MKIVLFVEGETEYNCLPNFMGRWLNPQLKKPIGIKPVNMNSNSNLISEVSKRVIQYIDKANVVAVISVMDLYGSEHYPSSNTSVFQRYQWIRDRMEGVVNHPKYKHFCLVHETEALLLCDPNLFPVKYRIR